MRIQAHALAKTHPTVALALLERYFELGVNMDNALGFVAQAEAHLALGDIDAAILAFQHAFVVERARPTVQTNAWSAYAELVVMLPRPELFDDVLALLDEKSDHAVFPVSRFIANGARAIIYDARGRPDAKDAARFALEAAAATRSGFVHHPKLGLVAPRHDAMCERIQRIIERPRHPADVTVSSIVSPVVAIAADRRGSPAAEALLAELRRDTSFATAYAEEMADLAARREALHQAEAPLVRALNDVGIDVSSVWKLLSRRAPYLAALPVLLRHLDEPYPSLIRDGIARALAVREARFARDELKQHYLREPDKQVKGALALALGATSDGRDVADLLAIIRDDRHGTSRILLLQDMVRIMPRADVDALLDELGSRVDLSLEIAAMKKQRERNRKQREKRLASRRTLH